MALSFGPWICTGKYKNILCIFTTVPFISNSHEVILNYCNAVMQSHRGEIFAYPMFLQKEITASPPAFFCMDVICKYWPYIQRIAEACPEYSHLTTMKPLLSVLHAKAHGIKCEVFFTHPLCFDASNFSMSNPISLTEPKQQCMFPWTQINRLHCMFLKCQIKWGGGNQDGAGSTLGEEVEMVNSFLSRTAIITSSWAKEVGCRLWYFMKYQIFFIFDILCAE